VDEDGEPDGPEAVQGMNGFFARFDTDGTPRWTRTVSGDGLQGVGDLAVLDDGDLLVLGIHSGPADVDGDAAPDVEFATLGPGVIEDHLDANGFLARFDAAGALRWVRRYAASPLQLAANGSRIVMSGMYSGALDLDGDGVIERADDGDPRSEGFAAVLDGEGTIRHVFTVTGGGADQIAAVGFSPDGRELYTTGFVRLGADFDGDDEIEGATVCHALGDLFLARYDLPE
jgi:hypothetical protein